jgi:hypothetical protein
LDYEINDLLNKYRYGPVPLSQFGFCWGVYFVKKEVSYQDNFNSDEFNAAKNEVFDIVVEVEGSEGYPLG